MNRENEKAMFARMNKPHVERVHVDVPENNERVDSNHLKNQVDFMKKNNESKKPLWRNLNPPPVTLTFYDDNTKKSENMNYLTMGDSPIDTSFNKYRNDLIKRLKHQKLGQSVGWETPNGKVVIEKGEDVPIDYIKNNPEQLEKLKMYGHTDKLWETKRILVFPKNGKNIEKIIYGKVINDPFFIHNSECPRCYKKKQLVTTSDINGNPIQLCSSCKKGQDMANKMFGNKQA